MIAIDIRKTQLVVERVRHEGGQPVEPVLKKGSISIVVKNPFARHFASEAELAVFMDSLRRSADEMARELVEALGGAATIQSFGKGAVVGAMGEIEHGAIWHAPGGAAARMALGGAKAQVPSSKKIGNVGAQVDIPLVYVHASMVRSHYDVIAVVVPDAPKPDEIVFSLVMATGGRVHARIGGLAVAETEGNNGLT